MKLACRARRAAIAVALLLLCAPARASAHELPGSSATLVVRDGGFVELRLLVPWSDVMRAQLMPRATPEVFLGTMANQSPAAFARTYAQLTTRIEQELRAVSNGSTSRAFTHWRWPAASEVQNALRSELMERLAAPASDHHGERLLATADVKGEPALSAIQLQTCALLGPVLVTAYRPVEQFVKTGARSAPFAIGKL